MLRHSAFDALLVLLAVLHGALLVGIPSAPLIAAGVWWNSNTIAHNFLHLPFFRSARLNGLFAAYLTALLGIPQRLWRDRHLAHHAERRWRLQLSSELTAQCVIVAAVWGCLLWQAPDFFAGTYMPGWVGGLALCQLHGYFEHARGTTSHYGRLYNLLLFNDGYHREHHAHPRVHWTTLPRRYDQQVPGSRWPAPLRWLDAFSLEILEKGLLHIPPLQGWVLRCHARAFRALLPDVQHARRITIVGGGLSPRTAIILRELLPEASLTIVEGRADHITLAQRHLPPQVQIVEKWFNETCAPDADLIIIPLSFKGGRSGFYSRRSDGCSFIIHDWIWRPRGRTAVVSWLLLKRINLVPYESSGADRCVTPGARTGAGGP